jgi:flagellar hook-length control protein FliK
MGVRIESSSSSVLTAKASSAASVASSSAVSKEEVKSAQKTDFSRELEKAQPKKKESAKPTDEATVKPAVVKGTKKKQGVKGKEKTDEATEDGEVSEADGTVTDEQAAPVEGAEEGDGTEQVVNAGDAKGTAVVKGDGVATDEGDNTDGEAVAAEVKGQAAVQEPVVEGEVQEEGEEAPPVQLKRGKGAGDGVQGRQTPVAGVVAQQGGVGVVKTSKGSGHEDGDSQRVTGNDGRGAAPVQDTETKQAVKAVGQGQDDGGDADTQEDTGETVAQGKLAVGPLAKATVDAASPAAQFHEMFVSASDKGDGEDEDKGATVTVSPTDVALTAMVNDATAGTKQAGETKQAQVAPAPLPVPPEVRFAEDNHPKVVSAVKTELLPGGGTIQLRLDPPDLGPMRLEVRMEDGQMSASFVTASDQATSLLTHSLGQLKHALEGAGISVDKLQVRQGSADSFSENMEQQKQGTSDQSAGQQEQQRREMLNRMWQKVAGGDPLDLVA